MEKPPAKAQKILPVRQQCCSKGCGKRARLQLGWRAFHCDVPDDQRNLAIPVEAYTNQAVCYDHIPVSVPAFIPLYEIARIQHFMEVLAHKAPLDFEHADVIAKKLKGDYAQPTIPRPVEQIPVRIN